MKTEKLFKRTDGRGAGIGGDGGRGLRIGEVSQATGVGVETLRFYERRGLLGRPRRTEANYRIYDDAVVEQVGFIKRAQAVGFTLDEVAEIMAESAGGRSPCHEVRAMARRKLDELNRRLAELRRYRDELQRTLREWDERGEEAGRVCGLIEHSSLSAPANSPDNWQAAKKGTRKR
ncbi:MAG TPA: MerR family transcriptional regulator [Pyrinomonadaceae bacterium]|jgi:DNA-binding transcriptional MerR regulator|nr:MerR family transcriptional regulator [Pyrinomonadaceae bacterium]